MTTPERPARRERVVHPRTEAAATTHRRGVRRDLREQTPLGVTLITSLRRTQLRLGLVVMIGVGIVVGGLPLLFLALPGLREARVGGLAAGWVVLGVLLFPVICIAGWLYARQADRNEREFVDLVERS